MFHNCRHIPTVYAVPMASQLIPLDEPEEYTLTCLLLLAPAESDSPLPYERPPKQINTVVNEIGNE